MSKPRPLAAIVLAAGEGKRFKSETPKVLHALCGKPLLSYVLEALEPIDVARTVVVVGRGADEVKAATKQATKRKLSFALQDKQLGTADAARVADDALGKFTGDVLILPGDSPLLTTDTLQALIEHHRDTRAAATVLTAELDDPSGYGRILRGRDGSVERIVEHRDATADERKMKEVNTSVWVFDRAALRTALTKIDRSNAQQEFYLTDVVTVLKDKGEPVEAYTAQDADEALGANSRVELA
ncbi:MAG: sugar phosphate nucleotidyltransferase, partial [Actinomycetota bacterium]